MKKMSILTLILILVFLFVGCGDDYESDYPADQPYTNDEINVEAPDSESGKSDNENESGSNPLNDDTNDEPTDDNDDEPDDVNDIPPQENPLDTTPPETSNSPQGTTPGGNQGHGNDDRPINIDPPPLIIPSGVSLNQSTATLDIGGTFTFTATVIPANAANRTVSWSSNSAAVTVNNGVVTAVSAGKATITATTHNGRTATASVIVREASTPPPIQPTGITLNHNSITLDIGGTVNLIANVLPANAANRTVTWSSDNQAATVNNGTVTAVRAGTAVITATTSNGFTATAIVTVREPAPSANPARAVFDDVNAERARHGLSALQWCDQLAAAALGHSIDVVGRGFGGHTGSDGREPSDRAGRPVVENLASRSATADPSSVAPSWMTSTIHRNNMLNSNATVAGIGWYNGFFTLKIAVT